MRARPSSGPGRWFALLLVALLLVGGFAINAGEAKHKPKPPKPAATFAMVPSSPGCLAKARATVRVFRQGVVEQLTLTAQGLPKNRNFDFFVIQQPDAPFGLSWYQGDFRTDGQGKGEQSYVGRFNVETFIVAPGVVPAPQVDGRDAATNPATAPVHTFHLGLWFNSPQDAQAAGCPNTVTPFNGDHNAGVQVLKTRNLANGLGPLSQIGS